ncbi:hypothetical protein NQ314_016338 [Rhamnusium bicolor]|uniref:Uncharacterized protein n=1 Tax=Rhamnusium bicolor TaxID=1586634 RepID=A0AAV8WW23_9CUCU|nr:hypothetical protein NQ314_016338 [Rhamnusium bicolor]
MKKKKRIQHLNELLEAFKRGRPTLNPHVEVKKRTKKTEIIPQKKIEMKQEISESDSEDNYNTDEEKAKNKQESSDEDLGDDTNKNKKMGEPIPSTSKCDFDLFADDSPPRHLLPKRIKSETSVDSNDFNKPSTSKQSSENNKNKESISYSTTDATPNVNFSTQDLLDNIV